MGRRKTAAVLARSIGSTIVCDTCENEKNYKLFARRKGGVRDGTCMECRSKATKRWYSKNKVYAVLRQKAYNSGRPYTPEHLQLIKQAFETGGEEAAKAVAAAIDKDRLAGGTGLPRTESSEIELA